MPRRGVTQELIVETALSVADAEGLHALTMRRLATELKASPMAFYKHIPGKPELLAAMTEAGMASIQEPDPDEPWERQIQSFFRSMFAVLIEHPSVGHLMAMGRAVGPETFRRGDAVLAALATAGMTNEEAATAFISLASYTIGSALLARPRSDDQTVAEALRHLPPDKFPALTAAAGALATFDSRGAFEAGLTQLLGGYGARSGLLVESSA